VEAAFTRDELLANLTIYWVTNTIASSTRLYYESRHARDQLGPGQRVEVPTGFADFPGEIIRHPRSWIARAYNLGHYRTMPRGGHFAALEQPELLAGEMREFFRSRRG
jgi:pimeloyl-ACP methyl ester carboxylesterase